MRNRSAEAFATIAVCDVTATAAPFMFISCTHQSETKGYLCPLQDYSEFSILHEIFVE